MITYRLVERSHKCNGDTGKEGLVTGCPVTGCVADEFEPGYHPLYHPDPNNDNVSGVFNPGSLPPGRVETEGDGIIDAAFPCPDIGAKSDYQLQRIINLVHYLFSHAVPLQASDIHIEPTSSGSQVRLRVDGVLHDFLLLPLKNGPCSGHQVKGDG